MRVNQFRIKTETSSPSIIIPFLFSYFCSDGFPIVVNASLQKLKLYSTPSFSYQLIVVPTKIGLSTAVAVWSRTRRVGHVRSAVQQASKTNAAGRVQYRVHDSRRSGENVESGRREYKIEIGKRGEYILFYFFFIV